MTYNGSQVLPQDRESVFYFNFLQIPPTNIGDKDKQKSNQLLVLVKNRVKLFYRPVAIADRIANLNNEIRVTGTSGTQGSRIVIHNDSPFYVSIATVKIKQQGIQHAKSANMISPFSQESVEFKEITSLKKLTALIEYINDQGAKVSHEYTITQ